VKCLDLGQERVEKGGAGMTVSRTVSGLGEDRMTRRVVLGLLGGGTLLGAWGCGSNGDMPPPRSSASRRPSEKPLASAFSPRHGVDVPRSVLECPAGPCILLHFELRNDYRADPMTDLLEGRPETDQDDGEIVSAAGTSWQVAQPAELAQFNCCAYAVGDTIGLGVGDWLCGEVNPLTDGSNPMQVVLESYFEQVAEFPPPFSTDAIRSFESSRDIRDGDVVCLVGSRGPDYPHAMRVRGRDGHHWVEGKFGEDPILWTPLETVGGAYEGQFDQVRVFRYKAGLEVS